MPMSKPSNLQNGTGTFMPGQVRIVDYDVANNNILVRGSAAFGAIVSDTTRLFVISDLINAIKSDSNWPEVSQAGITLGANPFIMDFCLIGGFPSTVPAPTLDAQIVYNEETWFSPNPPSLNGESLGSYPQIVYAEIESNPGIMVFWPVQSVGWDANHLYPYLVNQAWTISPKPSIDFSSYNFQQMPLLINIALKNEVWPAFPTTQNSIIYVHCDSGVNRTGAVIVSYLMLFGSNVSKFGLAPTQPSKPYP
ncbi:MAG: hypothetical protein ACD_69C00286G0002, partial [uncultured bacterium]